MLSSDQAFEDYQNECLNELLPFQDNFMKSYGINSYEEWYYNHGIGVFEFKSNNGKNLYFKYVDVGSFSTKTNTWNWSWDNTSTPTRVKRRMEEVKAFGEANRFDQLTEGLFDGDEYTGWAMTAITAKLLGCIGAYRAPSDHLFIYFLFTSEVSQEEYHNLRENSILCDRHTSGKIAFICQHVNKETYTGFHEAFESNPFIEEDDDYQAWCDECEKVRLKEGKWNDVSIAFANIKLVCDQCYFEIKSRNQTNA